MVLTTAFNIKIRNREYQRRHIEKINSGAPIRSKRKHSSPLPAQKIGLSYLQLKKNLHEDLPTTTAKKYKADEPDYDRILLPDEIEDTDELYLMEEQIDKMFQNIQTAANNRYKVKYLSVEQFESNAPLPAIEDTDIIVVPLVQRSNRQINLAVFNLLTSTVWLFCQYYQQKRFLFNEIKSKMETQYEINFNIVPKRECDKLINILPYSYNDIVLVFRTAEELFFTGSVQKFDNFNLDAERKRYRDIYDLMNSNDWDGNLPPTLQSEDRNDNEEEDNDDTLRDGTSATVSLSDVRVIESSGDDGESNTLRDSINETHSNISGYYDFDDLQSPHPQVPNPSTSQSFYSSETPSSSFLHSSSSNLVNNQLNSSILPPIRQLVSYSVSTTSSISDHELITTASTQNAQADLSNLENENIEPSIIASEQSSSDVTYSSGYSLDSGTVDEAWLARCAETSAIVKNFKPLDFNYRVYRDWRRSLSPKRFRDKVIECASLSSGESSSESEDDEEIDVELPPRYYNDTNDLSDEEPNSEETLIIIEKCWSIFGNFRSYWGAVRKLAEERQSIIKRLKKQLSKKRTFTDDQIIHINARVKLIEEMLNSTIPIVPRWKVSYQNGSDKKIIIRKGYIYERIGETNEFQCVYKKKDIFENCSSFIKIDNSDTMIEGSFCFHHHPAADNEDYTEDAPLPPEPPISFRRVTKEGGKSGKYSKLMKLLKETSTEVVDWRSHINVCLENLKLIRGYLNDLENADNLRLSSRRNNPSLTVLKETKNLLKCIRLDCL